MVHLDVDPEIHYRFYEYAMCISRVRPRFFDRVGHETIHASSGNKHFFTKLCHCQTYLNYQQPPQISRNSYSNFYQNIFSKILIFKILYFQKLGQIFVGSVHNFDKSNDDKI